MASILSRPQCVKLPVLLLSVDCFTPIGAFSVKAMHKIFNLISPRVVDMGALWMS